MKPIDLRNATWSDVLTHITEDMVRVHLAWHAHGPGTTREIAQKSGISLLTFRPRTSDLYKLGLVALVDKEGSSGIYAYRDRPTAELSRAWQSRADFRSPDPRDDTPAHRSPLTAHADAPSERVGFITVEDAIASLSPAERRALGARLMGESAHGRHRSDASAPGTQQLDLLTA